MYALISNQEGEIKNYCSRRAKMTSSKLGISLTFLDTSQTVCETTTMLEEQREEHTCSSWLKFRPLHPANKTQRQRDKRDK